MTREHVTSRLRWFICSKIVKQPDLSLAEDEPIITGGIMDSMALAYLGVFVRPVHRFTGLYMRAIAPFRHFVVYPAIIGKMQSGWAARYGASGGRP